MQFLRIAALISILLAQLSCNVAGAVAYKVIGERVKAQYVPVPTDSMLVIAESFRTNASVAVDTDQLARLVTDEIDRHKIAPTIDPVKVMDLRSRNPSAFRKMTISEIGRQMGAKQVLYINVLDSGIETAGVEVIMRGSASAKIKIVDVETTQARWPQAVAEGHPVSVNTSAEKVEDGVNESTIRLQMQQKLALQIGRLFRNYVTDEQI
jgi:hypothetical protein